MGLALKMAGVRVLPIAAATVAANHLRDFEEQFEEGAGWLA